MRVHCDNNHEIFGRSKLVHQLTQNICLFCCLSCWATTTRHRHSPNNWVSSHGWNTWILSPDSPPCFLRCEKSRPKSFAKGVEAAPRFVWFGYHKKERFKGSIQFWKFWNDKNWCKLIMLHLFWAAVAWWNFHMLVADPALCLAWWVAGDILLLPVAFRYFLSLHIWKWLWYRITIS